MRHAARVADLVLLTRPRSPRLPFIVTSTPRPVARSLVPPQAALRLQNAASVTVRRIPALAHLQARRSLLIALDLHQCNCRRAVRRVASPRISKPLPALSIRRSQTCRPTACDLPVVRPRHELLYLHDTPLSAAAGQRTTVFQEVPIQRSIASRWPLLTSKLSDRPRSDSASHAPADMVSTGGRQLGFGGQTSMTPAPARSSKRASTRAVPGGLDHAARRSRPPRLAALCHFSPRSVSLTVRYPDRNRALPSDRAPSPSSGLDRSNLFDVSSWACARRVRPGLRASWHLAGHPVRWRLLSELARSDRQVRAGPVHRRTAKPCLVPLSRDCARPTGVDAASSADRRDAYYSVNPRSVRRNGFAAIGSELHPGCGWFRRGRSK